MLLATAPLIVDSLWLSSSLKTLGWLLFNYFALSNSTSTFINFSERANIKTCLVSWSWSPFKEVRTVRFAIYSLPHYVGPVLILDYCPSTWSCCWLELRVIDIPKGFSCKLRKFHMDSERFFYVWIIAAWCLNIVVGLDYSGCCSDLLFISSTKFSISSATWSFNFSSRSFYQFFSNLLIIFFHSSGFPSSETSSICSFNSFNYFYRINLNMF